MLELGRIRQIRDDLGHRDWRELGLEELARAAGLSRMTLHRRGVSREDILAGLAELLADEYQLATLPALTLLAPAPERLATALQARCAVDERYLGLLEAMHGVTADVFHEQGEGEVLTRGPFTDALKRILKDGVDEGTLAVHEDLDETATLLFNAAGWTYREMRLGHRWAPDKASRRITELLVAGMRP